MKSMTQSNARDNNTYHHRCTDWLEKEAIILSNPHLTTTELVQQFGFSKGQISRARCKQHHIVEPDSTGGKGAIWEDWAAELLREKGYFPELQHVNAPFDILLNGIVRIDVKTAHKPKEAPSLTTYINPIYQFIVKGGKKRLDADIYFLIIVPFREYFIIPTDNVPLNKRTIIFTWPYQRMLGRKWQQYYQRWDLLDAALAHPRYKEYTCRADDDNDSNLANAKLDKQPPAGVA